MDTLYNTGPELLKWIQPALVDQAHLASGSMLLFVAAYAALSTLTVIPMVNIGYRMVRTFFSP